VDYAATDRAGRVWYFDVAGGFTSHRSGLNKSDVLWKSIGKAAVLAQTGDAVLVILTTGLPAGGSAGAEALRQVTGPGKSIAAVIDMLAVSAGHELQALSSGS
jgi:hypothetical protein